MTGAEFIDQLMYDMYKSSVKTSDTTYRVQALGWLNLVLKDISTRQENGHFNFLEKTAYFKTLDGQMSYDFPPDIDGNKIYSVRRTDGDVRIDYIEPHIFDKYTPDPTISSGKPRNYTLWANSIKLFPIPDEDDIEIYERYIKTITLLTDGATITDVPAKWDDVILCGALVKASRLKAKEKSGISYIDLKQEYEDGISRMQIECTQVIDNSKVSESHRGGGMKFPYYEHPAGQ